MKKNSSPRKRYSAGLICLLVLVALDQITKYGASSVLKGTRGVSAIPGVFEFLYVENRGAAFGILENRQWIFIVIALVMTAAAVYGYLYLPTGRHFTPLRICLVLISSGALGNMLDRMIRHYVVDFLYFSLIDFPVFNLADCYVVIGAVLLILLMFTLYRKDEFESLNPRND